MSTERPGHSSLGSQEVIRVSRSQGQKLDGFGNGYRLPSPKLKILPSQKLKTEILKARERGMEGKDIFHFNLSTTLS